MREFSALKFIDGCLQYSSRIVCHDPGIWMVYVYAFLGETKSVLDHELKLLSLTKMLAVSTEYPAKYSIKPRKFFKKWAEKWLKLHIPCSWGSRSSDTVDGAGTKPSVWTPHAGPAACPFLAVASKRMYGTGFIKFVWRWRKRVEMKNDFVEEWSC